MKNKMYFITTILLIMAFFVNADGRRACFHYWGSNKNNPATPDRSYHYSNWVHDRHKIWSPPIYDPFFMPGFYYYETKNPSDAECSKNW